MSRRGDNIRKRKDGRWEGRYYSLDIVSGKRRCHSVYARTYTDTKKKLITAKNNTLSMQTAQKESERNVDYDQNLTLDDIADKWLQEIHKKRKYSTYIKYSNVYHAHIQSELGSRFLSSLTQKNMDQVLIANQPISQSLSASISCVLNQIMKYGAKEYGIIPYKLKPETEQKERTEVEVLTISEQSRLINWLHEDMNISKAGILLCMTTGIRLGEICALKWEDIDFENNIVSIHRTVQRISIKGSDRKTMLMEDEPKSCCSKRKIPLADYIVKILISYRENEGYLLQKVRPMEPRTYQNRYAKYLKEAHISRKNFHILRHTFATNCVNNGTDIKSLSEIMGHSDVRITLNRYVHPTLDTKRRYMNSLGVIYSDFLGQNKGQPNPLKPDSGEI